MAKRKRLEVPFGTDFPELETKSALPRGRPPIAEVAGEVAGRAAEAEMAQAMETARAEGRVVERLPLEKIEIHHLARDRMVIDDTEMAALKASLAERGQQSPIEVVRAQGGSFGLISGLRRVLALKEMGESHVLAFLRRPETAEDAYRAMIEENEIRSDLSFYERANIAVMAVGQGVYPTPKRAVAGLFAHVPSARRSKILRFVVIREKLGRALSFPAAIPEKLGLALATAIEADGRLAARIADALRKTPPADAGAERRTLERALRGPASSKPARTEIAPGVTLEAKAGRAVLTGKAVDEGFLEALTDFAVSHAKAKPAGR